ncbi:MAG: phosphoethanolamine--lipid A transferase [Deltaproteobacteria bacterium]|jgi:lipid A ethanolaminephosphotransferase|nr:phosphoethanolamine--lipid A transferase [Deltaproteobacteria bacterium]
MFKNMKISLMNGLKYFLAQKLNLASWKISCFLALFFEVILNLSLWRFASGSITINSTKDLFFAMSLPLFIFIGLYLIFTILLWPYIYKPILTILIIVSSVANYVMFQYGIFLDTNMMRNLFETNQREALEYINLSGLIWLVLTGLLPVCLLFKIKLKFKNIWSEIKSKIISLILCLAVLGLLASTLYQTYIIFGRNNHQITRLINPTNYLSGTIHYFLQQSRAKRVVKSLDPEASRQPNSETNYTVFVLIVGETARAMNFSLNGYPRPTNPKLANQDVISFINVTSSGTDTSVSVPAMFSRFPRSNFDLTEANYTENIIDLIKQVGYEVIWLENDNGCKRVCDRVFTRNMVAENDPAYCDNLVCYDEVLIKNFKNILDDIVQDTVIILHTIGSHGPAYYKRYPANFNIFKPTCETSEIQNCAAQDIINTYDNTILYTDHIINESIVTLQKYPQFKTSLLYLSDHGESLGENGIYLHGLPFIIAPAEQINVPLILWFSESMKTNQKISYDCLKKNISQPISHDFLFHSLASLLSIKTKWYEKELDLFKPCQIDP